MNRRFFLATLGFFGVGTLPKWNLRLLNSGSAQTEDRNRRFANRNNLPVTMNLHIANFLKENSVPDNHIFQAIERRLEQEKKLLSCEPTSWGYRYQFVDFRSYEEWLCTVKSNQLLKFDFAVNYKIMVNEHGNLNLLKNVYIGQKSA